MEQLANLPLPALMVFGAVVGVIFGFRYLGLWQGQQHTPPTSSTSAQVAAVIVDPTALNRATASVEALNITLIELCSLLREKIRVERQMAEELDRVREEMLIQREIGRRER